MADEAKADAPAPRRPRSRKRKWLKRCLFVVYVLVLAEVGCRAYWAVSRDVRFFGPRDILYRFYPRLRSSGVRKAELRRGDGHVDVLLLGGSVLEARCGTIEKHLKAMLAERIGPRVRTWNLSRRAHTSRDSLFKYRELPGKPFDVVLLYHGINETRMNSCPPGMFRADYTHSYWYKQIDRLQAYGRGIHFAVFPYTVEYTVIRILGRSRFGFYVPHHDPKERWVEFGADIKTADSLRGNYREILDLARRKDEPVLLMTFANYIPADYTTERFWNRSLDYGARMSPVETWGAPAHVAAGMAAHNEVVRELAKTREAGLFVDQEKLIAKSGKYFNDCCHLTDLGCRTFVKNVLEPICAVLRRNGQLDPPVGGD